MQLTDEIIGGIQEGMRFFDVKMIVGDIAPGQRTEGLPGDQEVIATIPIEQRDS